MGRARETFQMLLDLTQAPDSDTLSQFLARLPLVFRVVILSPHGYFGQQGVLGMPDTGGQVRRSRWSRIRIAFSTRPDDEMPGKVGFYPSYNFVFRSCTI